MNTVLSRISGAMMVLAAIATLAMMLHIAADVAGKYFFDEPIPATLEIVAWYYMIAAIFLPGAYVQFHRKHLMVELFTQKLSPARVALVEIFSFTISLLFMGTLFYLSLHTAILETARGEAQDATYFDLIVWPSRWVLPISVGLMTLILAYQIYESILTVRRGAPDAPPKPPV